MFATRVGFYKQPAPSTITVTGGTLTFDGSYSVRTFTGNGTLGISGGNLACDYLVVGGGGRGDTGNYDIAGSESGRGGGGGSGGQTLTGTTTINSGSYAVTIGGSQQNTTVGSLFTALKGNNGSFRTGGASVGGSGSGGTGGLGTGTAATNGNNGVLSSISGVSVRYGAGGGGGANFTAGTGGTTGGGTGGTYQGPTNATAGSPGTGSGGGGGATSSNNGGGGDGIFIIRYLTAGTN